MSWRAIQAEIKRQERSEQRRLRDLEKRAKEKAKLSALEQARLEVETHDSQIEVLLSVHKDQSEPRNWPHGSVALPPLEPRRQSHGELRGRQNEVLAAAGIPSFASPSLQAASDGAALDDKEFQEAQQTYLEELEEWRQDRDLARRVLAGDMAAFGETLTVLKPLDQISELCADARFTVHSARLVECQLQVRGTHIIPRESKALTTTGKVSTKAMPQARFHDIFQDYVCGCVLRVGREVLALLPVEIVVVTASVQIIDASTGQPANVAVLSAAMPRATLAQFSWDQVDPSDAIETLQRRGDVKASKKTGAFTPIEPLTSSDITHSNGETVSTLSEILARARSMSDSLVTRRKALAHD